jgi:hypothetical protein
MRGVTVFISCDRFQGGEYLDHNPPPGTHRIEDQRVLDGHPALTYESPVPPWWPCLLHPYVILLDVE